MAGGGTRDGGEWVRACGGGADEGGGRGGFGGGSPWTLWREKEIMDRRDSRLLSKRVCLSVVNGKGE